MEAWAGLGFAGAGSGPGNGRIDLRASQLMRPRRSDVTQFQGVTFPELPLRIQVVLIRVGRLEIRLVNCQADRSDVRKVEGPTALHRSKRKRLRNVMYQRI